MASDAATHDTLVTYLQAVFIAPVETATGREGWFGIGVLAVCGALVVVVGLYLVRTVRLSVLRDDRVTATSLAERRERSERLWRTAHELAAAGQLAEAVRMVYLSVKNVRSFSNVGVSPANVSDAHEGEGGVRWALVAGVVVVAVLMKRRTCP